MNLSFSKEDQEFQQEVRSFIEQNYPSEIKDLNLMADFKIIIGLFFCILLFSVIITSICTFIATQRFLKSKIEQLY